MRKVTIGLVVLGVLALAFMSMPMRAQNQGYPFPGFPPEFSPNVTSRPAKAQRSLVPAAKFVKVNNAIPNRYIVVLNDDVVSSEAPLNARHNAIAAIANSHAAAHLGNVGYIYETALKGYSIELPNEAAAIAISQNPQVKWVEEDGILHPAQDPSQSNPPWGLDAIDGSPFPLPSPPLPNGTTNGTYIYNEDGTGVNAYVLDTGINTQHQEFSTGFFSRATEAADCIAHADCRSGPPSQFVDGVCVFPMPNSTNNDCFGHGTHVAGTLGGNTYGVAKNVTIKSVKVCTNNPFYGMPSLRHHQWS